MSVYRYTKTSELENYEEYTLFTAANLLVD